MRVELVGEWGRGEDIVAMASCLWEEREGSVLLAIEWEDFVFTSLTFKADSLIWLDYGGPDVRGGPRDSLCQLYV